jgi:DNA-binding XRE family transcriptional regulator
MAKPAAKNLFLIRRKHLKMTRRELGEKIGVTEGTLFLWETDRSAPPLTRTSSLALALDLKQEEVEQEILRITRVTGKLGQTTPAAAPITAKNAGPSTISGRLPSQSQTYAKRSRRKKPAFKSTFG